MAMNRNVKAVDHDIFRCDRRVVRGAVKVTMRFKEIGRGVEKEMQGVNPCTCTSIPTPCPVHDDGNDRRNRIMGLTALIRNKRLLGRKDGFRQGVDNRIEVFLSILIISDRATGGNSGARLEVEDWAVTLRQSRKGWIGLGMEWDKCLKGEWEGKEEKNLLIPIEFTEEATTTLLIPNSPAISRVFHDIAEFLL
jgi:hypothetical protein